MADELRDNAQKSSLDHMTSLGKAALTVGVGAALFYRGGGKNILSKGARISESVLRSAKNEVGSLNMKSLTTQDLKNSFKSLTDPGDGALSKAIRHADSGPIRLRTNDPRSVIGATQENFLRLLRDRDKIIKDEFQSRTVKFPTAQRFAKKFAPDNTHLARQIERFAFDAPRHLNDPHAIDGILDKLKLKKDLGQDQIDEMLTFMRERMEDTSGFEKFKLDHQKVINEALAKAQDPEGIARVTGSASKQTAKQKMAEMALGDYRMTVDQVLENADKFEGNYITDYVIDSAGEGRNVIKEATTYLREFRSRIERELGTDAAAQFGQLYADPSLRIDRSGNVFSFSEFLDGVENLNRSLAETMPGKILKLREFGNRADAPSYNYTAASASLSDPILAKVTNKVNKGALTPEATHLRLYNRVYAFGQSGLNHVEELDNTYLVPRQGTVQKLLNQMAGNTDYRPSDNRISRALDIGQDGSPTMLDDLRSRINKFKDPSWSRKAVDDFIDRPDEIKQMLDLARESEDLNQEDVFSVIDQIKSINHFFSKNTYELNAEAVNKLIDQTDGEAKRLLQMLTLNDEDMLREILIKDSNSLRDVTSHLNQDLVSLMNTYVNNPRKARSMVSLKTDRSGFLGGKESANFFDTLRMEIGKEAFAQHALDQDDGGFYNFDRVLELIDSVDLSAETKRETMRLANWTALQQAGGVNARLTRGRDTDGLISDANRVLEMFLEPEDKTQVNAEFFEQFRDNLERMAKEKTSMFEESYQAFRENEDLVTSYYSNEFITMNKSISVMDVIKNINDTEKLKAFGRQFYAGRDNLEDVTTATTVPYFSLIRMSDALSKIGLSFSSTSTGSVADLTKAAFLKRGLPIAVGLTAFDYLSDMTEVVTGTSIKGAFASGVANMDLGMRRITDITGLSSVIQTEKELNPLLRYWTGDEYMTYDERKGWYENGYEEMRKGRWWNFGGIQEWRGSEVQYYQPNYLRRAHSNWRDESLYDNVWEKWSRSWLPTPTAPLSPIRYLMNPYWLEEKHAEDRPYPMTGSMFTEETPWGAILNPTVGELIKPKRRMHKDRLGSSFVDVRSLIEARNIEQFQKAKDENENHLIRFKDGSVEPVSFTPLDAPTHSERILRLRTWDGEIQDASTGSYQAFSGVMPAQDYIDGSTDSAGDGLEEGVVFGYSDGEGSGFGSSFGGDGLPTIEGLSFKDELEIEARSGKFLPGITDRVLSQVDPTYDIETINRGIRARARAAGSRPDQSGIITAESIYRREARYGSNILGNKEALADLRGLTGGDDFIGELAYTSRFALGIYGYGAFRMFPGQPYQKLEDASDINSMTRSFWDANTGGIGGGYAEIFRRFIPASNHKVDRINPLMNTMPDWMPDRFRFGNPYSKLPKGEMRLPGKGYESLNELHPDEYGAYGAFDRFKILADISPNSAEYKIWRDIATRTIDDPELKQEMREVRERVTEQSKSHSFEHYRFIGKSTRRDVVTVEEVLNNNHFKVMGDDQIYRLAGIEVSGEQGPDLLSQYLSPGSEIVMAVDKNPYTGTNDDELSSVNAAVYLQGESLNRQLLKSNLATRREGDRSAAASQGMYSDFQNARGHIYELLSHAPIPYFSQKFFRIRDPLESYKHEQTYGTSYASWSRPIDSFLKPGFERALMSDGEMVVGLGALALNQLAHSYSTSGGARKAANAALMLTNRGAFIGGFVGLAASGGGKGTKTMAQLGAMAQMAGWLYTRSDQPIEGTIGFATLGASVGGLLRKDIGIGKGALAGAVAGLAITGLRSNILEDGLDKTWIPERTQEKWDLQEYFDRLEYIKYSGLYEKAARKAYLFEGTDIKQLVNQYEKDREHTNAMRSELKEYRDIITDVYAHGDSRAERMLNEIDEKMAALEEREMLMTVGKWGRTALIYKQAMDSTIYGLDEDASWAQLLRALPTNEREYFLEFASETDPEKREEILKYTSPYQRRALQIAWDEDVDEPESMTSYFGDHTLPKATWSGWRPNVDLRDIEVKTIENEGMLLADFGYYESQLRDPDVIMADNLSPDDPSSPMAMRTSLIASLKGMGLTGVDVSVEPSNRKGIHVVADIVRITNYNIQEKVRNAFTF